MKPFDPIFEFVELNRTFHELLDHNFEDDEMDLQQALGLGESFGWDNLIKEYRLIILSEAGSGKTTEIRNIALKLREQGNTSFFLRLEHIPNHFEDAFEVGTYEAFKNWLSSGEEGWVFLDSVDEARLRDPGDFELAIRIVDRKLRIAKDRTHITITGRTTAWRPKTDLSLCLAHLPYPMLITSEVDQQFEGDGSNGSLQTITNDRDSDSRSGFKIVTLDNLTSDQVSIFIKARGIKDSKAFLDAVERADAWSFTTRPQDLEELVEFWNDNGEMGSRLDLMKNSIDRRLAERDQDRADSRPLSLEQARQGARLIAATTTLVKDPTLRVPDGSENSKGISIQNVLSDWNDKDLSTLLSRPIFDEAIYGAVRFHQRSVREYLTAEWFSELLSHETSRRNIEALFFRNQYGLDVIAPTLRPILPWLVILDDRIRERVRKVAPEIIFEGGDPSQLPIDVRRDILHKVCGQIVNNVSDRSTHDYSAVQRFSNPDLTEDVRKLINQYKDNDHIVSFLLRMVWLGQLSGALQEAMDIALTPSTRGYTGFTPI